MGQSVVNLTKYVQSLTKLKMYVNETLFRVRDKMYVAIP